MIEKKLYSSLKEVCERTYPVIFPQDIVFPAIIYYVIDDSANQATNGNLMNRNVRFQVDVYSHSYSESKTLKEEIVFKVLELNGGSISSQDLYDRDEKLHRQLIDFKIKRI